MLTADDTVILALIEGEREGSGVADALKLLIGDVDEDGVLEKREESDESAVVVPPHPCAAVDDTDILAVRVLVIVVHAEPLEEMVCMALLLDVPPVALAVNKAGDEDARDDKDNAGVPETDTVFITVITAVGDSESNNEPDIQLVAEITSLALP